MQVLRSAVFVDFDNVYLGLRNLDPAAAETFATKPSSWLDWLTSGRADATHRRFLMLVCYMNPNSFSRYRNCFTDSGFHVVDCPPLTASGKTSADMAMALDIMDTLAHPVRYDEFVIASADADFTHVVQRLRAHDRRTTLVTARQASAAYTSTCDVLIGPAQLLTALLPVRVEPVPVEMRAEDVERAVAAVRSAVAGQSPPLRLNTAAQRAQAAVPAVIPSRWAGAGSFSAFLRRFAPDLVIDTGPPGSVAAPIRATPVAPEPGATAMKVARATRTPALSAAAYARVFEELAGPWGEGSEAPIQLSKLVRDRTEAHGAAVSRTAANAVIRLLCSGYTYPQPSTAQSLAAAFLQAVLCRCENAGLTLSPAEIADLAVWIGAPVPATTAQAPAA